MPKPEQNTQIAILEWCEIQHPELRKFAIKIDNEGKRSVIVRNGKTIPVGLFLAKRMGLLPKASDLFFPFPTAKHYGLWMEVKPDGWKGPSGKAEKERVQGQLAFISAMIDKGYYGEMVVGVDQGIDLINRYLRGA